MAFKQEMYRDPAIYVANKESYNAGCFGCKNRIKSKNLFGRRWKCQMEIHGFPNNDRQTCKWGTR